jgi:hypothetical protein
MALFPGAGGDGNNVPLLFFLSQVESGAISRIFTQVYSVIRIKPTPVTNRPSGPISTWPSMPKRAKMDRRYLRRRSLDGQFDEGASSSAVSWHYAPGRSRARPFGFIAGQSQTSSLRG